MSVQQGGGGLMHPAIPRLTLYYRMARNAWARHAPVREASETLGINERAYCDLYIKDFPPLTWTSSSTSVGDLLTAEDFHVAFVSAGGQP